MKKIICNTVYDTQAATLVFKKTYGAFGDADGYEETLYKTESGKLFIYTNGGEASKYIKEDIKRISAAKADEWLAENA